MDTLTHDEIFAYFEQWAMDKLEHGHEMGSLSSDTPCHEFNLGEKFHPCVALFNSRSELHSSGAWITIIGNFRSN